MDRRHLIGIMKEQYPEAQENETWIPETDQEADWWIEINKEELNQMDHLADQLKEKIEFYKHQLEKVEKQKADKIEIMTGKLAVYLETKVDPDLIKKTKTQAKYQLPTGEIIKKFPKPKIVRDNEALLKWVKEREEFKEYVQVEEKVAWGELKKKTEQSGDFIVIKETGELVEGINLEFREPEIEIKY